MRDDKYWRFEIDVDGLLRLPSDKLEEKPHRTLFNMVDSTQNVKGSPKKVILVFNFIAKLPLGIIRARMQDELHKPGSKFLLEIEGLRMIEATKRGDPAYRKGAGFDTVDFLLKFATQPWIRRHSHAHLSQIIKEIEAGKGEHGKDNPIQLDPGMAPKPTVARVKKAVERKLTVTDHEVTIA